LIEAGDLARTEEFARLRVGSTKDFIMFAAVPSFSSALSVLLFFIAGVAVRFFPKVEPDQNADEHEGIGIEYGIYNVFCE
jgi:hypothetical protein